MNEHTLDVKHEDSGHLIVSLYIDDFIVLKNNSGLGPGSYLPILVQGEVGLGLIKFG